MENWFVSSVGEIFKSMKKVSNFYATTITFAMSTTSTLCSKLPGVLRVTHSSQTRGIWNDISLLVVSVLDIFTQKKFTNWEKRFLKSWMHSTSHIKMSKNCSRSWQYLTLSLLVSRMQTHTNKLRLQRGSGSMCPYQFLSRRTWSGNLLFSATLIFVISSMKDKKRGNKTKCPKNLYNRNNTKLLKCGSAIGGNCTELMRQ